MTILINESPLEMQYDKAEFSVKEVIKDLLVYAEKMTVEAEPAYKSMTSLYRKARDWRAVIESRRKELTEPLRRETSRINDKAKEMTDPLDRVISIANSKANRYVAILEEQKKKEEEELNMIASLFDCNEEVETIPSNKVIRGDGATLVKKLEKKFRLVDVSKVPAKYLLVNEELVRRDLKLGVENIPGLEVYEEQTTQLRVR